MIFGPVKTSQILIPKRGFSLVFKNAPVVQGANHEYRFIFYDESDIKISLVTPSLKIEQGQSLRDRKHHN